MRVNRSLTDAQKRARRQNGRFGHVQRNEATLSLAEAEQESWPARQARENIEGLAELSDAIRAEAPDAQTLNISRSERAHWGQKANFSVSVMDGQGRPLRLDPQGPVPKMIQKGVDSTKWAISGQSEASSMSINLDDIQKSTQASLDLLSAARDRGYDPRLSTALLSASNRGGEVFSEPSLEQRDQMALEVARTLPQSESILDIADSLDQVRQWEPQRRLQMRQYPRITAEKNRHDDRVSALLRDLAQQRQSILKQTEGYGSSPTFDAQAEKLVDHRLTEQLKSTVDDTVADTLERLEHKSRLSTAEKLEDAFDETGEVLTEKVTESRFGRLVNRVLGI